MSTQAERGGRSDAHVKKHPEKLDPQLASPIRLLRTWARNSHRRFTLVLQIRRDCLRQA
jgi:hypothetical protein